MSGRDLSFTLAIIALLALSITLVFIGIKHNAMKQICVNSGMELAYKYTYKSAGNYEEKRVCRKWELKKGR